MATERNVVDFKIHNLTEEQFQELKAQGKIDPNALYCTPDTTLKTNQITNCITEIPQDIKLELADGAIILKAGSKVYVPNGVGVFDQITMANDKILTQNWNSTEPVFIAWYDNSLTLRKITEVCSGATDTISDRFHWWYDTTNNVIKEIESDGTARTAKLCLPIAVLTMVGDNTATVTSIDQVFNGFGYIGSTIYMLPGVKGLIPNGRNDDGTLKNTSWATSDVITRTFVSTDNGVYTLGFDGYGFSRISTSVYRYEEQTNIQWNGQSKWEATLLGYISITNGAVNNVSTRTAFHAVDYNDFESTIAEINNSISAVDSSAIHKTGNETVNGKKTFETALRINDTGKDATVTPTSNRYWGGVEFADKNGVVTGYLRSNHYTSGLIINDIQVARNINGTQKYASLGVAIDANGTVVTECPTPSNSSNGTQIATTAWVRDLFEALYPVGAVYIGTQNSCPLASIVKKSDGSNSTWTLVSSGKALWTGNGTTGDGTVRNTPNTGANNTISAGLPNITGEFVAANSNAPAGSGAFTVKSTGDGKGWDGTAAMRSTYGFDASRSSTVYRNDVTTVQPPAYVVNVWRRTA